MQIIKMLWKFHIQKKILETLSYEMGSTGGDELARNTYSYHRIPLLKLYEKNWIKKWILDIVYCIKKDFSQFQTNENFARFL